MTGPPERYRYQEFPWFPAGSIDKALEHIAYRAPALHLMGAIKSLDEFEKLLDKCLESQSTKALFLPENKLGDQGCAMMCDFLKKDRTLKYLFMERNGVTDKGCKLLVEGLRHNKTLKTIMIGSNDIGDEGAKAMAEFIKDNQSIREFAIGAKLTDVGALYLAKGLNFNSTVKALYLLNSDIDMLGARVLAEVVSRHPSCDNVEVVSQKITLQQFQNMLKTLAEAELKEAFEAAVRNNEEGPWLRSKIMVVGQGRAGKTATVRSMLGLPYRDNLDSTVGASIQQSRTRNSNNEWNQDDNKIDFTKDTAARITALKIAKQRNQEAQMMESFDIEVFAEEYTKLHQEREKAKLAAIEERKKNIINPVMTDEEIANQFDAQMITNKNANLEDISFTIWDYGGQQVFYTLHHLFLTRYGIYLLVFDMRDVVYSQGKEKRLKERQALLGKEGKGIAGAAKQFANLMGKKPKQKKSKEKEKGEAKGKSKEDDEKGERDLPFDIDDLEQDEEFQKEKAAKQEEAKEYLLFWLNSVYMHASEAPLLIIGTFFDVVHTHEELKEVNDFVGELIKDKYEQVVPNGGMNFFPLNNKSPNLDTTMYVEPFKGAFGRNIEIVRDTIENVARNEEFVNQNLSLRWMKCLDEMLRQEPSYLKLQEVRKIANTCGIQSVAEVDQMLAFFHELGMLVHLTSTQNLKEIITTKPQWLVDALSKVIRDETLHKFDMDKVKAAGLIQDEELMFKKNIVTQDWLEFLWNKDQVNFLIDLMRRTMLISDWKYGKFSNETAYLVPSLIKDESEENAKIAAHYLSGFDKKKGFYSNEEANAIVFDFSKSFLPSGVFQRLLCLSIFHSTREETLDDSYSKSHPNQEPELYKSSATIYMGNGQVFKLYKHNLQILCVVEKEYIRAYKMLLSMMRKLKVDVMGKGLEWEVYMDVIQRNEEVGAKQGEIITTDEGMHHRFISYEEVKMRQLAPWFATDHEKEEDKKEVGEEIGVNLETFLQDLARF